MAGRLSGVVASKSVTEASKGVLTPCRHPDGGPCRVGSLTGAVASSRVTEAREGPLGTVGNRPLECKSKSGLDCEAYKTSRCESRLSARDGRQPSS